MTLSSLPISETEFAGYRIDSAISSKIGFMMDKSGTVLGLVIPDKKDFIALKQK
jgi:hypothetical protein